MRVSRLLAALLTGATERNRQIQRPRTTQPPSHVLSEKEAALSKGGAQQLKSPRHPQGRARVNDMACNTAAVLHACDGCIGMHLCMHAFVCPAGGTRSALKRGMRYAVVPPMDSGLRVKTLHPWCTALHTLRCSASYVLSLTMHAAHRNAPTRAAAALVHALSFKSTCPLEPKNGHAVICRRPTQRADDMQRGSEHVTTQYQAPPATPQGIQINQDRPRSDQMTSRKPSQGRGGPSATRGAHLGQEVPHEHPLAPLLLLFGGRLPPRGH